MKKLVLMTAAVWSVFACQNSSIDKRDEGIAYKETITINDVPKATLTFFGYGDSRCPEGANCFWAGYAAVDLLLSGVTAEGGVNEHVKMCLGDCRFFTKDSTKTGYVMADTLDKSFAGQQYRFILSALNPGPSLDTTRQKEVRRIMLKVEKK
jgi:hypothetical protein